MNKFWMGVWAVVVLGPGSYSAALSKPVDEATASHIQGEVNQVDGLSVVDVVAKDARLHFTINPGNRVSVADIAEAIKAGDPANSIKEPILENSTSGASGSTTR
jgi:hypothetical protein